MKILKQILKMTQRVFANSMKSSEDESTFNKSVFTLCEDKDGDKMSTLVSTS